MIYSIHSPILLLRAMKIAKKPCSSCFLFYLLWRRGRLGHCSHLKGEQKKCQTQWVEKVSNSKMSENVKLYFLFFTLPYVGIIISSFSGNSIPKKCSYFYHFEFHTLGIKSFRNPWLHGDDTYRIVQWIGSRNKQQPKDRNSVFMTTT